MKEKPLNKTIRTTITSQRSHSQEGMMILRMQAGK
jgi:hypothetical protein